MPTKIRCYEELTIEYLYNKFKYDPETGILIHKIKTNKNKIGDKVGWLTDTGYYRVKINGISYYAHRLIWAMQTGEHVPNDIEIDHIDGNRANNKWTNLRLANSSQNCWNYKRPITNKTGIKGVEFRKKSNNYRARIKFHGKKIHLGCFATIEEAAEAYERAAEILFGEFAECYR